MRNIELIALDLDGTLVSHTGYQISKENLDALERARRQGARIVINTGRPPEYCWKLTDYISFEGELIVNCGSRILEMPSRKTLAKDVIPLNVCQRYLSYCAEKGIMVLLCVDDKAYITDSDLKKLRAYTEHVHTNNVFHNVVESFDEILAQHPDDIDKVEAFAPKELLDELGEWVKENLPELLGNRTGSKVLELCSATAGKGSALRTLAERLNIPRERVMAVGDSGNDLNMFEYAGLSVAMGGSPAHVVANCHEVTGTLEEHGVAMAIEKFVLNNH